MSKLGADKSREKRAEDATRPVATPREVLYRFRREAGGLIVEEVQASDVRTVKRLSHDVFDIAFATLSAHVHKRLT